MDHLLHLRSRFNEHSPDTNISRLCAFSKKSVHLPLQQISLSPIFQSCSFEVPAHSAKPLAMNHCRSYLWSFPLPARTDSANWIADLGNLTLVISKGLHYATGGPLGKIVFNLSLVYKHWSLNTIALHTLEHKVVVGRNSINICVMIR